MFMKSIKNCFNERFLFLFKFIKKMWRDFLNLNKYKFGFYLGLITAASVVISVSIRDHYLSSEKRIEINQNLDLNGDGNNEVILNYGGASYLVNIDGGDSLYLVPLREGELSKRIIENP